MSFEITLSSDREHCPLCLSHYRTIRGMVYAPGEYVGTRCLSKWHEVAASSELHLTFEDRALMRGMRIGAD